MIEIQRFVSVLALWLLTANTGMAVRVVDFEIVLDGRVVMTGTTGDEGADADDVWQYLRFLCFRDADRGKNETDVLDQQPAKPRALRGQVELRARYGGSVRLTCLRLIPCNTQDGMAWQLHPADYLASFRHRTPLGQPSSGATASSSAWLACDDRPLVIAHRGASGYLPEHTREAASLAYGMQADVIEQDVVLTRDGIPIVAHDIHLDTVTDIADRYPGRARQDGRYYAIDFSLAEIKALRVNERVSWPERQTVFPGRFPQQQGRFEIATLAEMLELIQGLNQSCSRDVGIYPELKQPAWHRQQGQDLARAVLAVLDRYAYTSRRQHIYLQCFEANELRRLRQELHCDLTLIQLIGGDQESQRMWSEEGLAEISQYADGIGPSIDRVLSLDPQNHLHVSPLVAVARQHGLIIHAYTVRRDDLPPGFHNDAALIDACRQAGVDGLFCDFPDRARAALLESSPP